MSDGGEKTFHLWKEIHSMKRLIESLQDTLKLQCLNVQCATHYQYDPKSYFISYHFSEPYLIN